ncbi:MAG: helix-turn-helix domain-containing protein [Solidesulfovibrio sp.]
MEKQNPAGGPGFAEKMIVNDDTTLVPCPAENNNSASAQRSRMLAALHKGPVSTLKARREYDILHPAARVLELRARGHLIDTVPTDDFTSEGKPHRVALYRYRGEREAE